MNRYEATWCGPCQRIKPIYHQLSDEYTDVEFLVVDEGQNQELIQTLGIRGFPTFRFYINRTQVDEMVGANPMDLKSKIESLRPAAFNPFAGSGVSLGASSNTDPQQSEDPRAARLRKLGGAELSEDEQLARALALSQQDIISGSGDNTNPSSTETTEVEMTDSSQEGVGKSSLPTDDIEYNQEILTSLLEMGFPDIRAKKSLLATNQGSLESCISWIEEHQEDHDIDDPISFVDLTQHQPKAPLTAEEKQAKIAELQRRIVEKREQRKVEEKERAKVTELQRREMGQQMNEAREQIAEMQRKAEMEKRKREKDETKRELERVRAEIQKDKAERRARGGKLVGGIGESTTLSTSTDVSGTIEKKKSTPPQKSLTREEHVANCISKLKQYRVAGDGLVALKTLHVYVNNLLEKPMEDPKFRTIKLTNAAFKKRVASLVGGVALLKALGFVKNEQEEVLYLTVEARDETFLRWVHTQLEQGIKELS